MSLPLKARLGLALCQAAGFQPILLAPNQAALVFDAAGDQTGVVPAAGSEPHALSSTLTAALSQRVLGDGSGRTTLRDAAEQMRAEMARIPALAPLEPALLDLVAEFDKATGSTHPLAALDQVVEAML